MLVIFASSACRWLSALVTFCAFSVSSQRSGTPACSERSAISASSRSTPTTERMSAKVERRAAISSEKSSSSMSPASLPGAAQPLRRDPASGVALEQCRPPSALPLALDRAPRAAADAAVLDRRGRDHPDHPDVASDLGATLAIAGLIAAMLMVGELVGDIPSGWLVARIGERPAMIGAAGSRSIALVIALIAPNPVALGFGIFLDRSRRRRCSRSPGTRS